MNNDIKYTKDFYDQDCNIKRYGEAIDEVGLDSNGRKKLEETFNEMDTIYNIEDLEHGIINSLK